MPDQRPTILFYEANDDRFYGAGRVLLWLMQNLKQFSPLFVAPGQGELSQRVAAAGIPVQRMPLPPPWQAVARRPGRGGRMGRMLLAPTLAAHTLQLMQMMRRNHVLGVHANSTRAALLAGPAARMLGLPLWWHVRRQRPLGVSERLALALCDRVICVSQAVAQRLGNPAKAVVIHDGVPLARMPSTANGLAFRQRFGWGADDVVVGAVASLAPNKRHDLFIRMAQTLAPQHPQTRFVICGDAPAGVPPGYAGHLRALAADLVADGRLVFAGFVENMATAYAAMDVLCFPSDVEGFGLVAIEAMMMAVPVVRTATAGSADMIEHGRHGFLTPVGDLPALIQHVALLLQQPGLRTRMGQAAQAHARAHFSAAAMAARSEALFGERIRP